MTRIQIPTRPPRGPTHRKSGTLVIEPKVSRDLPIHPYIPTFRDTRSRARRHPRDWGVTKNDRTAAWPARSFLSPRALQAAKAVARRVWNFGKWACVEWRTGRPSRVRRPNRGLRLASGRGGCCVVSPYGDSRSPRLLPACPTEVRASFAHGVSMVNGRLLTAREVGEKLGLSTESVLHRHRRGELPVSGSARTCSQTQSGCPDLRRGPLVLGGPSPALPSTMRKHA
jgi:hypothetical protein